MDGWKCPVMKSGKLQITKLATPAVYANGLFYYSLPSDGGMREGKNQIGAGPFAKTEPILSNQPGFAG